MAIASMEGVDRLEPHQRRALAFGQLEEMMQQRIKDSNDYLGRPPLQASSLLFT
jgi:hypothetical protein